MINKYIFLQEYARSPISSEKRIKHNFRHDYNFMHYKEYVTMVSINNIKYLFNKIKNSL